MSIVAGTISVSPLGPTTVALAIMVASGGTGPYTYQWQRAADLNGQAQTFANIGTPGLTLTDTGLTADTRYWYQVVVTDSLAATVTSAQAAATTGQSPATGKIVVGERIARNLLATLGTISKANGYSLDAKPRRPNPGIGDALVDGGMTLVGGEPVIEEDRPQQMTQWLHPFMVVIEVVESEASLVSIDERRNRARADVEFALTYDASPSSRPNQTRGYLAEDTLVDDPIVPPVPPNAHEGQVVVVVQIRYRTKWNDPFTSIYDP